MTTNKVATIAKLTQNLEAIYFDKVRDIRIVIYIVVYTYDGIAKIKEAPLPSLFSAQILPA